MAGRPTSESCTQRESSRRRRSCSPASNSSWLQSRRPLANCRITRPAPSAPGSASSMGRYLIASSISAATLSLLAAAADERPLLGVVDDAQWLDHASAETLTFVARRLGADSVVLLFAAREPDRATFSAEGIPRLEIAGLGATAARTLLRLRAPELAELTVRQLVGLTRGNPLALLEVSRGLSTAQRAGRSPLDDPLRVTVEIERVYCDRAGAMSVDARRALLLVAASDAGDIDALWTR